MVNEIKVGDTLSWDNMPDDTMFYWAAYDDHYVKHGHRLAVRCSTHGREWFDLWVAPIVNFDEWVSNPNAAFKVLALSVPADAPADDLRALAERFEVREALGWQVLDRSKPPPGYEVRNTSYEDGDDEVGGYGVMIEEWSWYDGGGYTDSTATEAACIISAWEFFEEETSPPGLNPYSGLYAWSWYWGRIAEGGDIAERLYRAGWRPGMTAEDAARLLAEVQQ